MPQEKYFRLHLIWQTDARDVRGSCRGKQGINKHTTHDAYVFSCCFSLQGDCFGTLPAMPTLVPRNDARVLVCTWRPPSAAAGFPSELKPSLRATGGLCAHGRSNPLATTCETMRRRIPCPSRMNRTSRPLMTDHSHNARTSVPKRVQIEISFLGHPVYDYHFSGG